MIIAALSSSVVECRQCCQSSTVLHFVAFAASAHLAFDFPCDFLLFFFYYSFFCFLPLLCAYVLCILLSSLLVFLFQFLFDCNLIWRLHNKIDNSINTSRTQSVQRKEQEKATAQCADLTNNQKKRNSLQDVPRNLLKTYKRQNERGASVLKAVLDGEIPLALKLIDTDTQLKQFVV